MKTKSYLNPGSCGLGTFLLIAAIALWMMPATGRCGTIFVSNFSAGTIGEYTTSGTTVNASLVSGLNGPDGIALSGGNLFVANNDTGTIGEYNATTGAPVNPALVSGLSGPAAVALSGGNLFVTDFVSGTIGEYDATTGVPVNPALVSGLGGVPVGIAVSGGDLFISNFIPGTIGEYTTSGTTVNASLVSGLNQPTLIAVVTPSSVPDFGPGMFLVALVFASLICIHRRMAVTF
jgi:hypothetical protein